jgi:hypothetical protein
VTIEEPQILHPSGIPPQAPHVRVGVAEVLAIAP